MKDAFAIETKGLNRSFGTVHAVNDLHLNVPSGAVYGFLGANGAGKTTTIRMLMGILRANSGEIGICGVYGDKVSMKARRMVSYVSQEQFFYPWIKGKDLGDFVSGFYRTWDRNRFSKLLDQFQIPPNRRVDQLSGGMRTKLALALSLAASPKVLILDEPTTGLDPIARREFMDLVLECTRNDGRTVFFSSHLVNEVERFADHVGMINHGRLRFQGSLDEVYSTIRQVTYSRSIEALPESSDFEIWRTKKDENTVTQVIRSTDEQWWQSNYQSEEFKVERLSLEEAFLASASHSSTA